MPAGADHTGLMVEARVNGTLCGQTQTKMLTLDGEQRIVLVVDVRAAGAGADVGCGTPGQLVTLSFFQGVRLISTITTTWDNNQVHELRQSAIYLPLVAR